MPWKGGREGGREDRKAKFEHNHETHPLVACIVFIYDVWKKEASETSSFV